MLFFCLWKWGKGFTTAATAAGVRVLCVFLRYNGVVWLYAAADEEEDFAFYRFHVPYLHMHVRDVTQSCYLCLYAFISQEKCHEWCIHICIWIHTGCGSIHWKLSEYKSRFSTVIYTPLNIEYVCLSLAYVSKLIKSICIICILILPKNKSKKWL